MKSLIVSTLLAVAAAGAMIASPVNVTFTGANGQKDSSGYLISPYSATVNGVSTTVYCNDFANDVNVGQSYTANLTSLASGDLSATRYGSTSRTLQTSSTTSATYSGLQLYEMAAWLTTQFSTQGASGYSANGDIQDTIWGLFVSGTPHVSSSTWLYSAESNYSTIAVSNFSVLTNTPSRNGSTVQEFIVATPEPASMLLLGFGLVALSIAGRRFRRAVK